MRVLPEWQFKEISAQRSHNYTMYCCAISDESRLLTDLLSDYDSTGGVRPRIDPHQTVDVIIAFYLYQIVDIVSILMFLVVVINTPLPLHTQQLYIKY